MLELIPFSNYTMKIRAYNSKGWSDWSDPMTWPTAVYTPEASQSLFVNEKTASFIQLEWNAPRSNGLPVTNSKARIRKLGETEVIAEKEVDTATEVIALCPPPRLLCQSSECMLYSSGRRLWLGWA